ncbi:MAG TPA: hypothetical protein VM597_40845 [Gemmataceae bacterium]|jgi:hypothetical protein|nr:hypothetical protein [Gemmataceae bacterium]
MSGVPVASGAAATPWAANPKLFQSVEFLVTIGLLVLILLGGAVVLYVTDVWRRKQLAPDRESADALTSYRVMFERGEITEAEYVAVRNRIAAQMRQEIVPDRPTGAEPAPDSRTGTETPERPPEPPTG